MLREAHGANIINVAVAMKGRFGVWTNSKMDGIIEKDQRLREGPVAAEDRKLDFDELSDDEEVMMTGLMWSLYMGLGWVGKPTSVNAETRGLEAEATTGTWKSAELRLLDCQRLVGT